MTCQSDETKCGKGTQAGCCPYGTTCVDDVEGRCQVHKGAGVKGVSWTTGMGVGVGIGLGVLQAIV
jgi:hypothetical protein